MSGINSNLKQLYIAILKKNQEIKLWRRGTNWFMFDVYNGLSLVNSIILDIDNEPYYVSGVNDG